MGGFSNHGMSEGYFANRFDFIRLCTSKPQAATSLSVHEKKRCNQWITLSFTFSASVLSYV